MTAEDGAMLLLELDRAHDCTGSGGSTAGNAATPSSTAAADGPPASAAPSAAGTAATGSAPAAASGSAAGAVCTHAGRDHCGCRNPIRQNYGAPGYCCHCDLWICRPAPYAGEAREREIALVRGEPWEPARGGMGDEDGDALDREPEAPATMERRNGLVPSEQQVMTVVPGSFRWMECTVRSCRVVRLLNRGDAFCPGCGGWSLKEVA